MALWASKDAIESVIHFIERAFISGIIAPDISIINLNTIIVLEALKDSFILSFKAEIYNFIEILSKKAGINDYSFDFFRIYFSQTHIHLVQYYRYFNYISFGGYIIIIAWNISKIKQLCSYHVEPHAIVISKPSGMWRCVSSDGSARAIKVLLSSNHPTLPFSFRGCSLSRPRRPSRQKRNDFRSKSEWKDDNTEAGRQGKHGSIADGCNGGTGALSALPFPTRF